MLKQFELVDEILKALDKEGVLVNIIIVGSWCIYFYKHHFEEARILSNITTLDIDIDVNPLRKEKRKVNISDILISLGFDLRFHGDGSISLIHPEIKAEFLVPEIGRPAHDPIKIPGFGITAQPLRWLNLLEEEVITVDYKGMQVKVPHPARFAVHKLIISQRRIGRNPKVKKDIHQGIEVARMLIEMGQAGKLNEIIGGLSLKQKKLVRKALAGVDSSFIEKLLSNNGEV
ncbi:MAG: nucleotidyltransferase domain-containing protein [Candidatus Eremiobacteraeota bacterium]|nr:nucleotidyltransferase domain-containing protein [Candidatus Eremiobacteraeota bacterium]